MPEEYTPGVNYCPLDDGDHCMSCSPCYKKAGAAEVLNAEAPTKVQRIIQALRARQAVCAAENIALAHD